MNVTEILCLLEQVKLNSPNQWTARCPAHVDRTPSLSVGVGDGGRILLHCQAHCPIENILKNLNLTFSDLFQAGPSTMSPTKKTYASSKPAATSPASGLAVSKPKLTTFRKPGDTSDVPGLVDWHDLFTKPPYTPRWLAYPFLQEGRLLALYGPAKVGKSLFALELAASIASGRDFLGFPTIKSRVLYIDYENHPYSDILPRLEAMGFKLDDLANLFYLSYPDIQALDLPAGGKRLHDIVNKLQIDLAIVDTISRAIDGKENDIDTWRALFKHTEQILKRDGITFLRLDHTGKDLSKGARGGSAKEGDVDACWSFTKKKGKIHLVCEQERMPVEHHTLIIKVESSPVLSHKLEEFESFESAEQRINKIAKELDDINLPRDATNKETGAAIRKQLGSPVPNKLVEDIVRQRKQSMLAEEPTENLDPYEDETYDSYKSPTENLDPWGEETDDSCELPINNRLTHPDYDWGYGRESLSRAIHGTDGMLQHI